MDPDFSVFSDIALRNELARTEASLRANPEGGRDIVRDCVADWARVVRAELARRETIGGAP